MSEFVDFNKRSVTLPDGCKDLVEMLRRTQAAADPSIVGWPRDPTRPFPRIREIQPDNLPDVAKFLFEPGAKRRSAIICTPEEREIISLGRNKVRADIQGIFCFPENLEHRSEAATFFSGLGKEASPPQFALIEPAILRLEELLNYESFAGSELE